MSANITIPSVVQFFVNAPVQSNYILAKRNHKLTAICADINELKTVKIASEDTKNADQMGIYQLAAITLTPKLVINYNKYSKILIVKLEQLIRLNNLYLISQNIAPLTPSQMLDPTTGQLVINELTLLYHRLNSCWIFHCEADYYSRIYRLLSMVVAAQEGAAGKPICSNK